MRKTIRVGLMSLLTAAMACTGGPSSEEDTGATASAVGVALGDTTLTAWPTTT